MQSVGQVVARNSIFGVASQLALKLLSFVFTVGIVRQLGDYRFGQYATVTAFIGIFAIFGDLGMAGYAVREIAKDRSRVRDLFANMLVLRLLLALAVLLTNIGVAGIIGYDRQMIGWIALSSCALLLYVLQGPLEIILLGFERIDYTASLEVARQMIWIGAGALLLWLGWGVAGLIVASFCGVAATTLLSWRLVRRMTPLPLRIDIRSWVPLIVAGLPFGVTTFATMLSFKFDTVLLSRWRTPDEVGWYNIAYNLIFALLLLPSGFYKALVPSLTRQHQSKPSGTNQFYLHSVRLLWIMALPIAVGTTLLADRLIVLIYGDTYAKAGGVLQILIWVLPVLALTSLCGSITTVLHREHATARINIVNAVFNVTLNLWAIASYGLLGATVMTVATEVLGLIQFQLLLRDAFPIRQVLAECWPAVVPAAIMGATILLIWPLPVLLIIPIAALVYCGLLLACGGIQLTEAKALLDTVGAALLRKPATMVE